MALDRFGAEVFVLLKQHGISLESVLTLGRQHFSVPPERFPDVQGFTDFASETGDLDGARDAFADPFFQALGAKVVDSLDVSKYQGCSRIHDLNEPIPESWHASYDIVFDGGTLEHVFHFPNAITNAMSLVKEGGIFVTCTPSNNFNGHGFYQFSPELFFRLFGSGNGYRVILAALGESREGGRIFRIKDPKAIGARVSFSGKGPLLFLLAAQRISTKPVLETFPYQSDYQATWTAESEKPPPVSSSIPAGKPLKQWLRRILPKRATRRYDQFRSNLGFRHRSLIGLEKASTLSECLNLPDPASSPD